MKNLLILIMSVLGISALSYGVWMNFQYVRQSPPSSAQTPLTYEEPQPTQTAAPTADPTQAPTAAPTATSAPAATRSPNPTTVPNLYKTGDINKDNRVGIHDLSYMLSKWNTNDDSADLNNDNKVDIYDFSILLKDWDRD